MAYKRVRAMTAEAARKKGGGKTVVVTKVKIVKSYAKGGKPGMKTYGVWTRKKLPKKSKRGRKADRSRKSQERHERAYRRRKRK